MKNYYDKLDASNNEHNPNFGKKHFIQLPAMMTILGPTGSGKTNTLMNLIDSFKGTFSKFVFCVMNFDSDPLYVQFRERLEELAEKDGIDVEDYIQVFEDAEVPDVEELEEVPTLIIFDDLIGEKKANDKVAKFYKYGRRKHFSCIYLAQSYFDIPPFIRKQLKYLIIKRTNQVDDLKRILSKYGLSQYKGRLADIYNYCTSDFKHCMMIDLLRGVIYRDFIELIE